MKKLIFALILATGFCLPVFANSEFTDFLGEKEKEKNHRINLFYLDSFLSEKKIGGSELQLKINTRFLNKGNGLIGEISFQHLFGLNPAVISGLVPEGSAYMHDAHALAGYQWSLNDYLSVTPFVKARGIVTRGRGGDNLYGVEGGLETELVLYPKTSSLSLRYGAMLPLIHRYTGSDDIVPPTGFLLSNFETSLNYRIFEDWEIAVGYQLRNFPKNLGNSNLATSDLIFWNSIKFGLSYLF